MPKGTFTVPHRLFTEPCTRTDALSIRHCENFYSCSYSSYFVLSAASISMFMEFWGVWRFFIMLWQITLIQIFKLVDLSNQYPLSILFYCMRQEIEMHSKWAEQSRVCVPATSSGEVHVRQWCSGLQQCPKYSVCLMLGYIFPLSWLCRTGDKTNDSVYRYMFVSI